MIMFHFRLGVVFRRVFRGAGDGAVGVPVLLLFAGGGEQGRGLAREVIGAQRGLARRARALRRVGTGGRGGGERRRRGRTTGEQRRRTADGETEHGVGHFLPC